MYGAFPPGEANAHHLCNRSSSPARLLSIGSRHCGPETIHYPDDDITFDGLLMRDEKGDRIPAPSSDTRSRDEAAGPSVTQGRETATNLSATVRPVAA